MNRRSSSVLVLMVTAIVARGAFAASSPWLPAPGSLTTVGSYVFQTAERFFAGNDAVDLPTDLSQHTFSAYSEYGLADAWALDVRLGYAFSDFVQNPGLSPRASEEGQIDSNVGLRWRILDEAAGDTVTATLRAGLIVEGDYRVGAINAIGDGGTGGEFSALVGRYFDGGLSVAAELGYRTRAQPIPDEIFLNLRGGYAFAPKTRIGVFLQVAESLGGLDLTDPRFTPARFPAVNEDYQILGADVSYTITPRSFLSVSYAATVDGRNTGQQDIVSFSFGYSFF